MNKEFLDLLTAYLSGWKTVFDCDEWLAGIDWDDPKLSTENRSILGRLELLATEVAEGLRQEIEFSQEASAIIADATDLLYVPQPPLTDLKTVDSSNDSMVRPEFIVILEAAAQSWSISPRLVFG